MADSPKSRFNANDAEDLKDGGKDDALENKNGSMKKKKKGNLPPGLQNAISRKLGMPG